MITIVLADKHPLIRRLCREILQAEPDLKVVGEAGDYIQAIRLLREQRPQFLVTDYDLPGAPHSDLFEIITIAKDIFSGVRIIISSNEHEEAYIAKAIEMGASGYVTKPDACFELVNKIREITAR